MTKRKKTMSKTKALADRRNTTVASRTKLFQTKTDGTPKDVLLGKLMEAYLLTLDDDDDDDETGNDDATTTNQYGSSSFCDILDGLGMNNRNTGWRNTWKDLHTNEFIEQIEPGSSLFTSNFRLTEKGRTEASTEEIQELIAQTKKLNPKPQTNEELHAFIKSKLMNQRGHRNGGR